MPTVGIIDTTAPRPNVNLCKLRVGDTIRFTHADYRYIEFKLKNKNKATLKSYKGIDLCGKTPISEISWTIIQGGKEVDYLSTMHIVVNGITINASCADASMEFVIYEVK